MKNIIFISTEKNWEIIKNENVMGLGGRGLEKYPELNINDRCIIYLNKISVFAGVFSIIDTNFNKNIKWNEGTYPKLLKLQPIFIPKNYLPIKTIIKNLNFIKNKSFWYMTFRFPKFISNDDYEYILDTMR